MMDGEEVMSDWLEKELAEAEAKLEKTERKRQQQDDGVAVPPLQRLQDLQEEVECLELSRAVSLWHSGPSSGLIEEAQHCVGLAKLLSCHKVSSPTGKRLYEALLNQEYLPLHQYVRAKLVTCLRQSLHEAGYPSREGCTRLLEQCQDYDTREASVASYCFWLDRLQQAHKVLDCTTVDEVTVETSHVVLELCRPLVERVQFHFVNESQTNKTGCLTLTRIDRLPQWILDYIREHALEGGPWDFIDDGIGVIVKEAPFEFLSEMVHLAKHVLVQRNFFRHEVIAGPKMNPLHLTNGIEQLMLFDDYVRELSREQRHPVGLTQTFVASDKDLWDWWLDRERESALSALFETKTKERPPYRVSPRAELFCALIHSVQAKASLFDTPGPYLKHVAVPLCMNFLDAVHTSMTDLRNLLSQRKLLSDQDMRSNMEEWIELINGTHLASIHLLQTDNPRQFGFSGSDHDLARVGRSIEQLRDVLVDDQCAKTVVEIVLMERVRLASYLMRCSHLLATKEVAAHAGLSPDLQDTLSVVSAITETCGTATGEGSELDQFAPVAIRTNVVDRLADKFLEVVLDSHGMTPELVLEGCSVVSEDVKILFAGLDSPLARRLLDVCSFMTMDSHQMHTLRMALFGLVQSPTSLPEQELPILHVTQFSSDGTLLDEAISMLLAKGYGLYLEDAISILNRRKDSFL